MSLYYLMAQLPSLDAVNDAAPLPITEERFSELCERFLGKRASKIFRGLTLIPNREGEEHASKLVDAWNEEEKQLRLALASIRAAKMNKPQMSSDEPIPSHLTQTAKAAVQMEDPMEAERFLNGHRLDFLESLRPVDAFAEDAVYYYGLKLKLLSRIRGFDEERGRQAYRNIYDSILSGEEQEANE